MASHGPGRVVGAATACLAVSAVLGCGGSTARQPTGLSTSGTTTTVAPSSAAAPASAGSGATTAHDRQGHVVVVVFENKAYRQLAGSTDAPYLNQLMGRSAVFNNAHGVAHPSQPNYLALFSGSTQGVTDDHCPVRFGNQPNLAQQFLASGRSFVGYAEDLPQPGYRGCSRGRYAAKHNPWADFDSVPPTAGQPFTSWPTDPADLPTVAFVVPNMCHDMHDCPVRVGDAWAREHLDPYLRWAEAHDSWLIVTFDENDGSAGNTILTLVAGAGVRAGLRTESVDHYAVLRTIEDRYGLAPLGHAATAHPLALGQDPSR